MWKDGLAGSYPRQIDIPACPRQVLIALRKTIPEGKVDAVVEHSPEEVLPVTFVAERGSVILTAPCNSSEPASNVHLFTALLQNQTSLRTECFPCETGCNGSLIDALKAAPDSVVGAVVFDAFPSNVSTDKQVVYRLRMDSDRYGSAAGESTIVNTLPPSSLTKAWLRGVVPLQAAADKAIAGTILHSSGKEASSLSWYHALSTQQFPTPAFRDSSATEQLSNVLPIYMTLIFVLQVRGSG